MSVRQDAILHLRRVYFSVGSLAYFIVGPSIVFGTVWLLRGGNALNANFFLGSALMLAVVAPSFDQMAIGLADDRHGPLEFRRERARLGARLWAWAGIAVGASLLVVIVAAVISPMSLGFLGWLRFLLALALGATPIGLAAVALSFWFPHDQVRRWGKIAPFVLILGAGLVVPPFMLPGLLWRAANILPTRHYAEIVWSSGFGWVWPWASTLWLVLFAGVFAGAAIAGARRVYGDRAHGVAPVDGLP